MVGKSISGILAGAAAFAGTLAPSAAYEVSDVCSVEIGVLYTVGGGAHHGKPQKFTITSQEPSGFLQISPGTFTLSVDGKLCNTHEDYPSTIDAFKGITSYTLSENEISEAATKLDVICLDQEQASSSDEAIAMAPIIISVAIDQWVLKIGDTATVTVGAVDPNNGENPGEYAFAVANGGTVTNAAGSCAAGFCSAQYTASTTESGNQAFSFKVRDNDFDNNGLEDTVTGNIIVDDSGAVQFGLENYHRPSALTVSVDNEHLTYGQQATITITATDSDLTAALLAPDTLDLRAPGFQPNYRDTPGDDLTWQYPSNSGGTASASYILKQVFGNLDITADPHTAAHDLACNIGDFTEVSSNVPVGSNVKTWVLRWNPWNSASGAQSSYGLVSCAFDFQAFDSYNLLSDSIQVSLTATATDQDPSFSEIPFFESIMIDDISPTVGGEVEVRMFYSDPSTSTNAVNFALALPGGSGMIEEITRCDIDPATDTETNCDSPVAWVGTDFTFTDGSGCLPSGSGATYESGCSHILKVKIGASAQTGLGQAENVVTLTITDADSGYSDERELSYWNIASSRRAKRSEVPLQAHDGFALSFSISPTADGAALVANMAAAGDMSTDAVPEPEAEADGVGTVVGAVVGSVAAVAAIGAIVVRRRNREAAGANIDLGSTWESDGGATTIV